MPSRYPVERPIKKSVTIDPDGCGCGCTDCIVGEAINPSQLNSATVIGLIQLDIALDNRSSGTVTFTIERVDRGRPQSTNSSDDPEYEVFLMAPWREAKTAHSWHVNRSDLRMPVSFLELSFDEEGMPG